MSSCCLATAFCLASAASSSRNLAMRARITCKTDNLERRVGAQLSMLGRDTCVEHC
jgi:hypothetical protein